MSYEGMIISFDYDGKKYVTEKVRTDAGSTFTLEGSTKIFSKDKAKNIR